jgi:Gpi18-like mannosyltransferase
MKHTISPTPPYFWAKVGLVVAVIFGLVIIATLPGRTFDYTADVHPTQDDFQGFSTTQTGSSAGYRYAWVLQTAKIFYSRVPRYSPLSLRLRLDLDRPETMPPIRIEIYCGTSDPTHPARLITTIESDPARSGPQDFYLTVPARDSDKGLTVELRTNLAKAAADNRPPGFKFVEAELSLPPYHLIYLIWPYPYWVAGLLVLAGIVAWALRAGLAIFETGLLAGLTGFSIMAIAPSTYQHSGVLLGIAAGFWLLYWWNNLYLKRNLYKIWPLMAATALLLLFFLFSSDEYLADIWHYVRWSKSIHDNGIWNIYAFDNRLDYLPLIVYLIYFYNFVAYPLGLENNYLAWRVISALMYLGVVGMIYLIGRSAHSEPAHKPGIYRGLVLVAFNAGFFFNAVVWGQTDMLAILTLTVAFYLIYRNHTVWGSLALGLALISKPQAWFVLPLLGWMLVRRSGLPKALAGLGLSGAIVLVLGGIAFGGNLNNVFAYFNSPEFGGTYLNSNPSAFNFNYLLLGTARLTPPLWLSLSGFGITGLVLLGVMYYSYSHPRSLSEYGAGAALVAITCFSYLIKMKERYLIFGFPFLGIAILQNNRLYKPFLVLSWLQLIQLVAILFEYTPRKKITLADQPYLWSVLLEQDWTRRALALCVLLLGAYLVIYYLKAVGLVYKSNKVLAVKPVVVSPEWSYEEKSL